MSKIPENAKKVFEGILFDVYQWEQKLFDGSTTTFEMIKKEGSSQVLAIKDNKIILLKEEQPHKGKFTSLPGGKIEKGETPEQNAKKELLEELGMTCEELTLWETSNWGTTINWPTHYFIAKNCKKVSDLNLDAGEKIQAYEVSFDELFEETEKKEFRNKGFSNILFRIQHTPGEKEKFRKLLFE